MVYKLHELYVAHHGLLYFSVISVVKMKEKQCPRFRSQVNNTRHTQYAT